MALVTQTYLVDDLDGTTEGVETVQLNAEGTNFEIDLSAANAARLRERLERFVAAASPVKVPKAVPASRGRAKAAAVRTNRDQTKDIRQWAEAAGLEVSTRGRIAKSVQDAYAAAH